jgi:ABC-type transport system substrate-binding protein
VTGTLTPLPGLTLPLWKHYPSAAQVLQTSFSCQSFVPGSANNSNRSEFCDPGLDAEIDSALAAEGNNAPDTAALWAQADQTATDQAPVVPLATQALVNLVSARVGHFGSRGSLAPGILGRAQRAHLAATARKLRGPATVERVPESRP